MAFITAPKGEEECFLCAKGRPAAFADPEQHVIARGRLAYVLLNAFPYNSGHLLVAPYRHVADLVDLAAAERAEILELVAQAETVMRRTMQPDGFNVGFNLGAAAGAGVPGHVHAHLVPRWQGDTNFMPVVGDVRVVPQALAETARLLRAAWAAPAPVG
jgi:ATP adenylyltransferase